MDVKRRYKMIDIIGLEYNQCKAELLKEQNVLVDYVKLHYVDDESETLKTKALSYMRLSQYYLPNFVLKLSKMDLYIAQQIEKIRELWGRLNKIGEKMRIWY